MSVMFANDFSALSKMLAFEDARDQKLLETYFSTDEIEHALNRMCIRIIFVSHQWLAWAEPDPVNMQYDCIAQGLEAF